MLAWYYTVENLDKPSKLPISTYLKPTSPGTHSIIPGHYPVLPALWAAAAGWVEGFVCVTKTFYCGHPRSWLLFFVLQLQMSAEDYVTVATEVSIQIVTQTEALHFHGLHGLIVEFSPLWVCQEELRECRQFLPAPCSAHSARIKLCCHNARSL